MGAVWEHEDWPESATVATCDQCGTVCRCEFQENPYMSEIHPEDPSAGDKSWWCYSCHCESCMDI